MIKFMKINNIVKFKQMKTSNKLLLGLLVVVILVITVCMFMLRV